MLVCTHCHRQHPHGTFSEQGKAQTRTRCINCRERGRLRMPGAARSELQRSGRSAAIRVRLVHVWAFRGAEGGTNVVGSRERD